MRLKYSLRVIIRSMKFKIASYFKYCQKRKSLHIYHKMKINKIMKAPSFNIN